jgi:Mg2+/Co2+ transporter CorB
MLSSLWLLALTVGVLIVASAFFSSSETALTAASDARMRQLANKGNKRAKIVEKLRADREGLIGSILIGNNAVNVLGSALATSFAIRLFGEGGLVWATIGMTVLLVVFAEVMPKTYAFTYADSYALADCAGVAIGGSGA